MFNQRIFGRAEIFSDSSKRFPTCTIWRSPGMAMTSAPPIFNEKSTRGLWGMVTRMLEKQGKTGTSGRNVARTGTDSQNSDACTDRPKDWKRVRMCRDLLRTTLPESYSDQLSSKRRARMDGQADFGRLQGPSEITRSCLNKLSVTAQMCPRFRDAGN